MDSSRRDTVTKVLNWLDGANKPRYSVTPSPGPGSQISHRRLIPYERQTEGNLSPGPSQYWGNRTHVSRTENAPSNAEPCPDLNGPTLVEIVGQQAEQVARRAPAAGSIYIGPVPWIQFDYPPGRDPATCFSDTGTGQDRQYRWDLQASAVVNLPNGTRRPLDLIDQHSLKAAVVYSQLDTNGRFAQGDMERLDQGLFDSLNGLYRGKHHQDGYIPTTEVDDITDKDVWVATSRYRDRDGTQFTAAIHFVSPPPST
jgi:hypothetical protein